MFYPRILIISNNCLSKSDSNGRTLGNFISLWPKECVAQFCIHGTGRDLDVCSDYYVVSDMQALKSFAFGKKIDGRRTGDFAENTAGAVSISKKGVKRSPATMLIRNAAWKSLRWQNGFFNEWVDSFNPEVVLLQAGDLPAFYDIAVKLAKQRRIPLVIYNSEEYYFKDYCYFGENAHFKWLYPLFHSKLKKSVNSAMQYAVGSIYISDYLKKLYDDEFGSRSVTIMTSATEIADKPVEKKLPEKSPYIIYAGNLGVGRHKAIIEIGKALQKIDGSFKIAVFGACDNPAAEKELNACKGIKYNGTIPYNELQKEIKSADLLIHVESMRPYYIRDIKYGFSTKLADCLSSGIPLFVYASSELTGIRYLKENECAVVADSTDRLLPMLKTALFDEKARENCVNNAIRIANKNHNIEENKKLFYSFVVNSL